MLDCVESKVWDDEDIDREDVVEEVETKVNVGDVDEEEVDIPCDDDEFVMDELLSVVVCELVGGSEAELHKKGQISTCAVEQPTSSLRRTRRWRRRRT